jgi:hypothetical protein
MAKPADRCSSEIRHDCAASQVSRISTSLLMLKETDSQQRRRNRSCVASGRGGRCGPLFDVAARIAFSEANDWTAEKHRSLPGARASARGLGESRCRTAPFGGSVSSQ